MTTTPASAANERALVDCPFCGSAARGPHKDNCYFTELARLKCAPPADLTAVPDVIDAWNRRAIPQPAAEMVIGFLGKTGRGEMCAFTARQKARDFAGNSGSVVPIGIEVTAPDRAPSTDSAADAQDAARWRWAREAAWDEIKSAFWCNEVQSGISPDACTAALDTVVDRAIAAMQPKGDAA